MSLPVLPTSCLLSMFGDVGVPAEIVASTISGTSTVTIVLVSGVDVAADHEGTKTSATPTPLTFIFLFLGARSAVGVSAQLAASTTSETPTSALTFLPFVAFLAKSLPYCTPAPGPPPLLAFLSTSWIWDEAHAGARTQARVYGRDEGAGSLTRHARVPSILGGA
jgi:hypothetical protein